MSGRTAARSLPDRPSLEHLKNQARRRLRDLKAGGAAAKLADAQLGIARDYGFSSWRELKSFVEGQARPAGRFANLVGFYRHDPQPPQTGNMYAYFPKPFRSLEIRARAAAGKSSH